MASFFDGLDILLAEKKSPVSKMAGARLRPSESVMDGRTEPSKEELERANAERDAITAPTIGPISIDPIDYLTPGGLAKAGALIGKAVLAPAAAVTGLMVGASKLKGSVPGKLHGKVAPGQEGAIVKHASPYKFEAFSLEKLRTGEGSNVIAPGIYLSEHPSTNEFYKTVVKKVLDPTTNPTLEAKRYNLRLIQQTIGPNDQYNSLDTAEKALADALFAHRISKFEPTNYTVDLPDEQIAKMLDWDKPLKGLSEQEKSTLQLIAKRESLPAPYQDLNLTEDLIGKDFYNALVNKTMKPRLAAATLDSYGIKGIRYLDRLSRGVGGTNNFVVFDPDILKILNTEPIK